MIAYWFGRDILPYPDCREVAVGVTHKVETPIIPGKHGLHGSIHPSDAMRFADTEILWLVDLGGEIVLDSPKWEKGICTVASERTYLARVDAKDLLCDHARWCASKVMHLWNAPYVVRRYLETGDRTLRFEAKLACASASSGYDRPSWAAWGEAGSPRGDAILAAWHATNVEINTGDAALSAVRGAISHAALAAASVAWDAAFPGRARARDAAFNASINAQRDRFLNLVKMEFVAQEKIKNDQNTNLINIISDHKLD